MRKNMMTVNVAAAKIDNAFTRSEKSAFSAAYDVRTTWEAWKAGNVVDDDEKPVKTFAAVVKACARDDARKAADKAAAVGLFIDRYKGRDAVAADFTGFEYGKLYTISYRANMRRAYETGGIDAARAVAFDFVNKYGITSATSTRDIESAGKPAKRDNAKAAAEVKEAEAAEAARVAEKQAEADKEARAKHAAALKARKADFDSVMDVIKASYTGNKSDFRKLVAAARAAAFGDDDYKASEYVAAAKAEADKAAAKAEADKAAAKAAKAEARDKRGGGVSNVTITTPEAEAEAAKAGGKSVVPAGKAEAEAARAKAAHIEKRAAEKRGAEVRTK